jgi:hypothetical protein
MPAHWPPSPVGWWHPSSAHPASHSALAELRRNGPKQGAARPPTRPPRSARCRSPRGASSGACCCSRRAMSPYMMKPPRCRRRPSRRRTMSPCIPQQKDSGTCPLDNRTRPGCRPTYTLSDDQSPEPCHHIVSTLALATCRRGMVWSRRCRAYISVGGLLMTVDGRPQRTLRSRTCLSRGCRQAIAQVPAGEVVL